MTSYGKGTLVWFRDATSVWKAGSVLESSDKGYLIESSDGDTISVSSKEELPLRNTDEYTSEGLVVLDDLTQLTHLHEPAVLHSLQIRFDTDKIYTFTGPILIAVNPFKRIPGLYSDIQLCHFLRCVSGGGPPPKPHVFATALAAYQGLCEHRKSQTVLISGESGAGKTETTKFVMKFLASAGAAADHAPPSADKAGPLPAMSDIEVKVLESNPILEAFGNARTLRNDNSSRFGKFIELQFSGGKSLQRLTGAKIQTYLLEKVRVTDQQEGERNFHIFYQCCAARMAGGGLYHLDNCSLDLSGFSDLSEFSYLTKSSVVSLEATDDVEEFERTMKAMLTVGFSLTEMNQVLKVLAGILHLGNLRFNGETGGEAFVDESIAFSRVCELLGVPSNQLSRALTTRQIITKLETFHTPLTPAAAGDCRDALARTLYGLLFNYIVSRTNRTLSNSGSQPPSPKSSPLFCGVLDIFGFECFKQNSFEQLCINFTNERLQQFFNEFVFKLEEALYAKEGVPWDPLDFPDNQDAVDLLQDPRGGLFALLDEECVLPGGSDKNYCSKIRQKFAAHKRFEANKLAAESFSVRHFAGPVQYASDGFLEKNKDSQSSEIAAVFSNSSNSLVVELFTTPSRLSPRKAGRTTTVSAEFREQLSVLMEAVTRTEPHFIRCIKPNPQNIPDVYDRPSVTEQLRYGGVLQAVQVSRAGFPVRVTHLDCWLDYRCLLTTDKGSRQSVSALGAVEDLAERVRRMLSVISSSNLSDWSVGKSLVFFKHTSFEQLQTARLKIRHSAAVRVQAMLRGRRERRNFQVSLHRVIQVQALARRLLARVQVNLLRRKNAGILLVRLMSGVLARQKFLLKKRAVTVISSWLRGRKTRKWVKQYKLHVSAGKIQSLFRGWRVRRMYESMRSVCGNFQRLWRARSAKLQLRRLKNEAKEVGALLNKFQKTQEELMELKKKQADLEAGKLHAQQEVSQLHKRVAVLTDELDSAVREKEFIKKSATEQVENIKNEYEGSIRGALSSFAGVDVQSSSLSSFLSQISSLQLQLSETQKLVDDQSMEISTLKESLVNSQKQASDFESKLSSTASRKPESSPRQLDLSAKPAEIVIVGAHSVGKSLMLIDLIKRLDPNQMSQISEQQGNLVAHSKIGFSFASGQVQPVNHL